MSRPLLASIIISSYNYGRFLQEAIDSALGQTYPHTEVIVVDDASTDDSPRIVAAYGDRIIPILRERNEGGRATYNAACRLSHGDVILILDSDDILCPGAVQRAVEHFQDPDVVKVHWPLWIVDARGRKTGHIDPDTALPDGDVRERIPGNGPFYYAYPSTSGNAYSRAFLERALPVPYPTYADAYLAMWALVSGTVRRISEPQGFYRTHGHNTYGSKNFDERLERDIAHALRCTQELRDYYRSRGIQVDTETWLKNSWQHRIYLSTQEIKALVPEGDSFILVDEDNWATSGCVAGRPAPPFPEQNGSYGGTPPDDESAIREVERLRQAGARWIVFAWQAFWWLDYYSGLRGYLRSNFRCLLENERLRVFDLRSRAVLS